MKRDDKKQATKSETTEKKLFGAKLGASKKLVELDDADLRLVAGGGLNCGGIGIPG